MPIKIEDILFACTFIDKTLGDKKIAIDIPVDKVSLEILGSVVDNKGAMDNFPELRSHSSVPQRQLTVHQISKGSDSTVIDIKSDYPVDKDTISIEKEVSDDGPTKILSVFWSVSHSFLHGICSPFCTFLSALSALHLTVYLSPVSVCLTFSLSVSSYYIQLPPPTTTSTP